MTLRESTFGDTSNAATVTKRDVSLLASLNCILAKSANKAGSLQVTEASQIKIFGEAPPKSNLFIT
jgi:hypothetical protein